MKAKTFIGFVGPSMFLMALFIAFPLISVLWQSFHVTQVQYETVTVENCRPGFLAQICETQEKIRPILDDNGKQVEVTKFVGLDTYRSLLEPESITAAFSELGRGWKDILDIDFYKALRFTLTFTLITLPLVVGMGLMIALSVHNSVKKMKGPIIFISLLPFIVTPIIGALSIKWLFIGDGIMTAALERLTGEEIAMFAQGWTIEILMLFYRVWHVAPFAFVVFYAGLQTMDMETMESAIMDGASRWERLRYVVIPHLMPLIVFISLIHLMDAYRVFEEVIAFASQAHVISLQFLTYDFLLPDDSGNRAISRASASSMLTMVGIVIMLAPLLMKTWRDHKGTQK